MWLLRANSDTKTVHIVENLFRSYKNDMILGNPKVFTVPSSLPPNKFLYGPCFVSRGILVVEQKINSVRFHNCMLDIMLGIAEIIKSVY